MKQLAKQSGDEESVRELKSTAEIAEAVGTGGCSGQWGYINHASGWADAEAAMLFARKLLESTHRVTFLTGQATRLLHHNRKITGVRLHNNQTLAADLVILATGAWTGALLDLSGRAEATGQVLAYLHLTDAEQIRLARMPVMLNFSTGMFIIPPRHNLLKVARHGYGYTNPTRIPHPELPNATLDLSTPSPAGVPIPSEGAEACRAALREIIPELGDRAFCKTRICWYTDTPDGDFLVDWHPRYEGLVVATGGSGHAFKFLPVLGERVVDLLEESLEGELRRLWAWKGEATGGVVTEDGSRGGRKGMVLKDQIDKGERSKL